MNILLLDDNRKRREEIKEALKGKSHEVVDCAITNDFLEEIEKDNYQLLMLDFETWKKGGSIYRYFKVGKLLEKFPLLLYNANENIKGLPDRTNLENDRIIPKPFDLATLLESV